MSELSEQPFIDMDDYDGPATELPAAYRNLDEDMRVELKKTAAAVVGEFVGKPEPVENYNMFSDASNPVELLGQIMGYASMCWENVSGAGEFSAEKAQEGLEHAINRLAQISDQGVSNVASGVSDRV